MSRKQRKKLAKQREKALKEGRKYSNYADEYTAQIHWDYIAYTTERSARNKALSLAMQAHPQEAAVDMLRKRVTSAFLPDYKLNKKDSPQANRISKLHRRRKNRQRITFMARRSRKMQCWMALCSRFAPCALLQRCLHRSTSVRIFPR